MTTEDRAPIFDPLTQRWSWWSTPGKRSSFRDDQKVAQEVTIEWRLKESSFDRKWFGVLPTLPGFVMFMWCIADGYLWLRRPEGVWKAKMPKIKRKDMLLVNEIANDVPGGLRWPIAAWPTASTTSWHPAGDSYDFSLEGKDKGMNGAMWGDVPVLINTASQTGLPEIGNDLLPFKIELFSRPGNCRFYLGELSGQPHDCDTSALIIKLPNDVHIAHLLASSVRDFPPLENGLILAFGGDEWINLHLQKVIVVDASGTAS